MKTDKKGQVTPFIIVGVVIVIVAVLVVVFMKPKISNVSVTTTAQMDPVRDYVEECIRIKGEKALTKVGEQGGVIEGDKNSFVDYKDSKKTPLFRGPEEEYDVYVWLDENGGRNFNIDDEYVGEQISNYVNKNIDDCLSGLDKFGNLEVSGNRKINTTVGLYNTIIILELPITFNGKDTTIETFSYNFNYALGEFLNIGEYIINLKSKNPIKDICSEINNNEDIYGEYRCLRPLSDKGDEIYILNLKRGNDKADNSYKFQFAFKRIK